jgi:uncharacterized protein YjhX (UPF0386 family)
MQSPDQVYQDAVRRLQLAQEDRSAAKQRILEGLTQRIRDSFERQLKEDLDLMNEYCFNREDYCIYDDYYGVPKEIFEQLIKQVLTEYPGKRYQYAYHGMNRTRASIRIEPTDITEGVAHMDLMDHDMGVFSPDHVHEVIEQKKAIRERHIKESNEAEEIKWIQEQMGYAREAFEEGLKYFQMDGPSPWDILTDNPYEFTESFPVRYDTDRAILQRVVDEKNQLGATHEYYIMTKDSHTPLIGIRHKQQQ